MSIIITNSFYAKRKEYVDMRTAYCEWVKFSYTYAIIFL